MKALQQKSEEERKENISYIKSNETENINPKDYEISKEDHNEIICVLMGQPSMKMNRDVTQKKI